MRAVISGKEVKVQSNTINISKEILQFSTCSFTIKVFKDNENFFEEGQEVIVYNRDDKIFSGVLDNITYQNATADGGIEFQVDCKGYVYYTSKRVVVKAYVSSSSGDIVTDLWETYLKQEGVELGEIQNGRTITNTQFNYIYVEDALNELADKNGYYWTIDKDKKLHFIDNKTFKAPFDLEFDVAEKGSIVIKKGNPDYRNVQYLVDCKGITDLMIEYQKGDGEKESFAVGYPVAEKPRISISRNGEAFIEETVGVKGLHDNNDWYFAYNDHVITQDMEGEKLGENDVVKIEYKGLYDLVVIARDPGEVIRKSEIEGGTGLSEHIKSDNSRGIEVALEKAEEFVEKYATDGTIITYNTYMDGLEPGMIQNVHLANYGIINQEFLIISIGETEDNGSVLKSVEAIKGPVANDWANFFVREEKTSRINRISAGVTEVGLVQPVYNFTKTWQEHETNNLFARSIYPNNSEYPNTDIYPTLSKTTPIRYIAWYDDNGVEIGRVRLTQSIIKEEEIFTIGFIGSSVEGMIGYIGWIGGTFATDELGTGIVIDYQYLGILKTRLELFQIEKYDYKGW